MPSEEFRIGENYLFDSSVTLTPSSEDPSFPADNLRDFLTSKVLRTSGNFVIDSSNNRIDFKDVSGGAELRATITSGTYSPQELESAIESAMGAVGGFSYTVTYSSTTGRWTIASSSTVYFALLWSSGTDSASSVGASIGFDTSSDLTSALTYTGASIAIHTEESLVMDLRTTEAIDSFAMIFDKTRGNQFSSEAVLKLQANATDLWTAPAVDVTLSLDETYEVITYFASASSSYRYWRLKVVDPRNPNLYVEIPKLFLSKATQLSQVPSGGWSLKTDDRSKEETTPYGHSYSDIYPALRSIALSYQFISAADLELIESLYERVGPVTPIFISIDGQASLFDKDRLFIYGNLKKDLSRTHSFYSYFNTGFTVEEAL